MQNLTKMDKYELSRSRKKCKSCGVEITHLNKFSDLPCEEYCCWCCPHSKELPCPKEQDYGTFLDHFKIDTEKQILKALKRKRIFIGYMMLCRYLNNRGYIRYGCNCGYPEDDKSGNAKIDPCPILCPDVSHSIGSVRYYVNKLAKKGRLYRKTIEFYDSKNPYSLTSPKKLDRFTIICKSEKMFQKFIDQNKIMRFIK